MDGKRDRLKGRWMDGWMDGWMVLPWYERRKN